MFADMVQPPAAHSGLTTCFAEPFLSNVLAVAGQYAAAAAAGNATAAAWFANNSLIGSPDSVDMLVPLSVVAIRDGGRLGALAAANATEWGSGTRFGPRDSYQR